jgi:NAD(P)-dependent dehydrogenase (short-subunit alcohol dehydrogenase family)
MYLQLLLATVSIAAALRIPANRLIKMSYSIPDQPERFAIGKAENNQRMLNIESVYDPSYLKNKVVLVTGGNRGLGLAIVTELVSQGARVFITTRSPAEIPGVEKVISGIDVADNNCGEVLIKALAGTKIDYVINNAGYFYGPVEKIDSLNFEEELKMIDICALGPLRITSALVNGGLMEANSKVAMITSQGGSIAWRTTQNPTGHDYGHHMSKAAANMMSALLAQELKSKSICVIILHPGFNKTDMTKKYEHIWEVEGAVDSSVGAKRVLHEVGLASMETTGSFINCEDGLLIPW